MSSTTGEEAIPRNGAAGQGATPASSPGGEGGKPGKPKGVLNGILTALIVILFLIGAGFALYPAYSNLYNEYRNARAAIEYDRTVEAMDAAAVLQALADARAYNERHLLNVVVDPFEPGEGSMPTDEVYESLLNVQGNGIMGFVEIPAIAQKLPVYHGTSTEVLDKGIGHMQGTSLPVGGDSTHCVLSGHRGLASAKLFTDLDQLKVGDQFYLHVCGDHFAYEVESILVVKPEESSSLAIQQGRDLATLVTCTPYGVNSHRLLVRGHRVEYVPHEADTLAQRLAVFSPQALAFAAVLSAIVIVALVVFVRRLLMKGGGKR